MTKLTAILLLGACLQLAAKGRAQTVTLNLKKVPIQKVFTEISLQTGVSIMYNEALFKDAVTVSIQVKDASIPDVLKICLQNQSLSYTIDGQNIIIKPTEALQPADLSLSSFLPPPPIDIRGRVTDPDGEPLVGATVKVTGSNAVALTDGDGRFTLKGVDENASIEISYVGFVTHTLAVKNRANIVLVLKRNDSPLDEIQVGAYSKTSKRFQTGNVSTVKGEDIQKQPVSNPLLALIGRVPGLFITQSNGNAGSGVTVRIQGQNSILAGNDPLYVIDGMPYTSQMLSITGGGIMRGSGSSTIQPGGGGNPLSYINPSDIESIDVLKDADATSIYGSRAANGAILITTKKGKAGQAKVDINLQQGWGKVTHSVDMMNAKELLQMRHEAKRNDNAAISSTDYDLNGTWDTTRYTDWRKTFIGGISQYGNSSASISGGNASIQYLFGGTYHRETSVFPGDFSDQKGSVHFNLNSISANQKFKFQFSANYLTDNNQLPQTDLTGLSYLTPDYAPALFNPDGSLNWAPNSSGTSTWTNPISSFLNRFQSKTYNLISNAILSYRILPGLEIKSSFGYTNLQTNEISYTQLISYKPELRSLVSRNAVYTNSIIRSWQIEPQINYKQVIWKGKLEVLLGTTISKNNGDGQWLNGSGYNNDAVLANIQAAASVLVVSSLANVYRYNAIFGRINYNISDKYILNLTARRDGSSRFGPANQFNNFGSMAGSWIFSEEELFKKTLPFISFGKLKASIGTTGNDQIGDYTYLNLYNIVSPAVAYQGATGLYLNGIYNPLLQWENTRKLFFGIDLGFFKDRLLVSANYSQNRSSNQLLQYALPNITGNTGVKLNFPATVQNTSWEFTLNTRNVKTTDFNWNSNLNLTIPNNTLIAFPNLATSTYASSLIIGKPVSIKKVYHLLGVDPATGIYQFADSHGNPTSSPNGSTDNTSLINTLPKFYGGFQNSFRYKGLQLDILFQFVKQLGNSAIVFGYSSTPGSTPMTDQPISLLGRWEKPGDIAAFQRYNSNGSLAGQFNNANGSDAAYSDASYIRLKNLSLSCELPSKWIQKARLQNFLIYVQGQNLFTITKFKGLDPETSGIGLPPLNVLTMGVQIGL